MAAQPRNISKPLLILSAILAIFGVGSKLFGRTDKPFADDILEDCFQPPKNFVTCELSNVNKLSIDQCSTESLEILPKSVLPDPIKSFSESFSDGRPGLEINTPINAHLANHRYRLVSFLFKKFPEKNTQMLTTKDGNGCTPLLLALKLGAPSGILRTLISQDSALIADNEGITPLMLASRGVDPKVTQMLLKAIGTDFIQDELQRQDSRGRTVADWGKMDLFAIYDEFMKVEVDPQKSANSCFNTLHFPFPFGSQGKGMFNNNDVDEVKEAGFQIGPMVAQGIRYASFLATKHNVDKLLEISSDKGPSANRIREVLAKFFWPEVSDQTKINKYWKEIRKEMGQLKNQISSHRLLHVYGWNQNENRRIINEFANSASEQRSLRQASRTQ